MICVVSREQYNNSGEQRQDSVFLEVQANDLGAQPQRWGLRVGVGGDQGGGGAEERRGVKRRVLLPPPPPTVLLSSHFQIECAQDAPNQTDPPPIQPMKILPFLLAPTKLCNHSSVSLCHHHETTPTSPTPLPLPPPPVPFLPHPPLPLPTPTFPTLSYPPPMTSGISACPGWGFIHSKT